jgi:cyclopropane fatty-acyl-phospholipid synthase-like methyltransferase
MTDDDARRHAPATQRNREPILAILRRELPQTGGTLLEVASGSGEHAVFMAPQLPGWVWQASDADPAARASIMAWAAVEGVSLPAALTIDAASAATWPAGPYQAILCINMIHIAPWEAALGLIGAAGRLLPASAPLILYGPYKRNGQHTADSNAAFDADLRARDPRWGVRDLGDVADLAAAHGFGPAMVHEMPANNLTVVFRKR